MRISCDQLNKTAGSTSYVILRGCFLVAIVPWNHVSLHESNLSLMFTNLRPQMVFVLVFHRVIIAELRDELL